MTLKTRPVACALMWAALCTSIPGVADVANSVMPHDSNGQPVISQTVSVSDAVGIALKNSPSIASRKALLSATSARVGMAQAMTRLQVSTTTFANDGDMPMIFRGPENVQPQSISLTSDQSRLNQTVMAMYPIYTGGRNQGLVSGAKANTVAAKYDLAITELDVVLAVKQNYYRVQFARRTVEAYQSRVNEATERVRISEVAYAAGRIAKYDLLRNQTELADAQQMLVNAQADVEMAFIELRNMMGISQTSLLALSDDLSVQPAPPAINELQVTAIRQSPEVSAMQARVASAQSNIEVAKSAMKPQIYATAMAEISVSKSSGMSSGTDKGYLVGLTAAIPLFDGGSRRSSIQEAQAMHEQMQADQRETVLNIAKSVATAYTQLGAATKNVCLAQAAITQAEEDYRVIRMRYEAGKATNVEVLDSLASLTRSKTSYIEALYTQNMAQAAITRAIGQR
ncbi:MAG: TolC family protein [Armatimonadota bacterium]